MKVATVGRLKGARRKKRRMGIREKEERRGAADTKVVTNMKGVTGMKEAGEGKKVNGVIAAGENSVTKTGVMSTGRDLLDFPVAGILLPTGIGFRRAKDVRLGNP